MTSHENAPAASIRAMCPGTCPSSCGAKSAAEVTKAKMTLPGGPMRVASQKVFWTAASSAPTAISTAVESVSEPATRATARPAAIPRITRRTVRARRAYGRLCP